MKRRLWLVALLVLSVGAVAVAQQLQVQSNSANLATETTLASADSSLSVIEGAVETTTANKVRSLLVDGNGTALTLGSDGTHDSASVTAGPQMIAECDDTSTDAVDEGDAAKVRVNCTTRELKVEVSQPLAAGTNNIGDVDVASIAAGDNNIGNVDIASAIPAGSNSIGEVTGASDKPIIACDSVKVIDTASAGNVELVALSGATNIYICSYTITAEATVDVRLVAGTGTACATSEAGITGLYALSTTTGVLGVTRGSGLGMVTKTETAGDALCIELGGAVQVNGEITYAQY
jgi:hypothetical protein